MMGQPETIRVHVHWAVKVIAILGIVGFAYLAYVTWQDGWMLESVVMGCFTFMGTAVFFLSDSKIDVNQEAIWLTAPHGIYRLYWSEIQSFEPNGQATYLFGENKALSYDLRLVGKGKSEFQKTIAEIIHQRNIPIGRPVGMSDDQIQKLIQNSKVRGWKLF